MILGGDITIDTYYNHYVAEAPLVDPGVAVLLDPRDVGQCLVLAPWPRRE